jgi:hypothetical protein
MTRSDRTPNTVSSCVAPAVVLWQAGAAFIRSFSLTSTTSGCFAMAQSPLLRHAVPFFVVSCFLLYFFSSGVQHELSRDNPTILMNGPSQLLCQLGIPYIVPFDGSFLLYFRHVGFPDFGHYKRKGTLSAEQLSLGYWVPLSFVGDKPTCAHR